MGSDWCQCSVVVHGLQPLYQSFHQPDRSSAEEEDPHLRTCCEAKPTVNSRPVLQRLGCPDTCSTPFATRGQHLRSKTMPTLLLRLRIEDRVDPIRPKYFRFFLKIQCATPQ